MEQAARLVRVCCYDLPAGSIAVILESPMPVSGRDGWTLIYGSDISFSPTSLPPHFPGAIDAATPFLVG